MRYCWLVGVGAHDAARDRLEYMDGMQVGWYCSMEGCSMGYFCTLMLCHLSNC